MTDDDRPPEAAAAPDWTLLARRVASGDVAGALDHGASENERMLGALAAALRPRLPDPPTAQETERALRLALDRRAVPSGEGRARPRPRVARPGVRWAVGGIGLAAAAALVLVGRLALSPRDGAGRSAHRPTRPPAAPPAARTEVGQVASLRLPDGTRVILGPASVLDTSAGLAAGRREVSLRGEALFDVVHDAHRPFEVRTAQGIVRDLGTSFVVASHGATGTVVSVRSGSVFLRGGSPSFRGVVRLDAGDRARLADTGVVQVERRVVTDADVAWTHGHLTLHDASVLDVQVALRQWYGIEFRVADAALARRRVTASFTDEPGADAARIVAAALGGSALVAGDTVTVIARAPAASVR